MRPYQGELRKLPHRSNSDRTVDEYDVMALAKRLGISIEEMKEMSYVSLINTLIASVNDEAIKEDSGFTREATPEDIKRYFG